MSVAAALACSAEGESSYRQLLAFHDSPPLRVQNVFVWYVVMTVFAPGCGGRRAEPGRTVGGRHREISARLVFPGTASSKERAEVDQEVAAVSVELTAGGVALAALVKRSSASKIERLVGGAPKQSGAWCSGEDAPDVDTREVMASKLRIDAGARGAA